MVPHLTCKQKITGSIPALSKWFLSVIIQYYTNKALWQFFSKNFTTKGNLASWNQGTGSGRDGFFYSITFFTSLSSWECDNKSPRKPNMYCEKSFTDPTSQDHYVSACHYQSEIAQKIWHNLPTSNIQLANEFQNTHKMLSYSKLSLWRKWIFLERTRACISWSQYFLDVQTIHWLWDNETANELKAFVQDDSCYI